MTKENEFFSLTHPEKRLWYEEKFHPGTTLWNLPLTVKFREILDFELLEKAINSVIERNDELRSRFVEEDNKPMKFISDFEEIELEVLDFSGMDGISELNVWIRQNSETPFEILDSDLFYFAGIRFNESETGFYFKVHHTICDGWSLGLVINQIVDTYRKMKDGEEISDEKMPSYSKFREIEEKYLESERFAVDSMYWKKMFEILPEPQDLKPHGLSQSLASERITLEIPQDIADEIYRFCEENQTSVYRLFLSTLCAYIFRVASREDIVIGTSIHNRMQEDLNDITGMFVSQIPFRIGVDREMDFGILMEKIRKQLKSIMGQQRYPYNYIIRDLRMEHGEIGKLFDVSIVQYLMNMYPEDVEVEFYSNGNTASSLTMFVAYDYKKDGVPQIKVYMDYQTELYSENEVKVVMNHLLNILREATKDPSLKLSRFQIISEEEKKILIQDFNDTFSPFPRDKTIHQLFEERVKLNPDSPAVVFRDIQYSYDGLNRKANQLARFLRNKEVKPEQLVGILVDKSPEMIIGLLGILKAGAAYLPIDPSYPADRIKYMLEDSGASIVLSREHLYDRLEFEGTVIDLDDNSLYRGDDSNPVIINKPTDMAYIIYTSGSTGKPKGVLIEHRSLVNLSTWHMRYFGLTTEDAVSKFAGFSFDASVIEIFPCVISGAALHILPDEIRLSPREVNDYFEANNVTVSYLPTQFGEQFMDLVDNTSLRWLYFGGDRLRIFRPHNYRIANAYGPSEYTVCTSIFEIDRMYENIPIGRPISNTKVFILDRFDNLQPVGAPGELCVSGAGIARGYLNRPDLTEMRFIDNAFFPGEKMYRTGDLARWLPDGNLEFLGRIDQQVKIRGFRIELGEIEYLMMQQEGVTGAVVVDKDDNKGNKYLCGYVVSTGGIDVGDMKKQLSKDLPDYMIPTYITRIDTIPLTPNGKIDRRALPEPVGIAGETTEYIPPENERQEKLLKIWQEVLDLQRIGIDDNFFKIGGHSLKAAVLQAKVEKEFHITFHLEQIFREPTIRKMAKNLPITEKIEEIPLLPVEEREYYPLSSAQERLFIMEQMGGIGTTYNVPLAVTLLGRLDIKRLAEAFREIIERNETLRTSFQMIKGEPVQVVHKNVKVKRSYREIPEENLEAVIADFVRPFDLKQAPIFRVELLKVADFKHVLLLDFHHIIFDGMSMMVFMEQLSALYNNEELSAPYIQYKDYAVWQRKVERSDSYREQEEFWLNEFSGEIPVLDLPTDHKRPAIQDYAGDRYHFIIGRDLTHNLNRISGETGSTLYMVLLASLNILLQKYTSQEDIIIGVPAAGRIREELQEVIGMFVNTLPVRNQPVEDKTFREFLTEVKENFLDAYKNQEYQLEHMVEKLNIKREPGRNPLFDLVFVFQNMGFSGLSLRDLEIDIESCGDRTSKFDILFEGEEKNGEIVFSIEYRTSLFETETIDRMSKHFINILSSLCENSDLLIRDINILNPDEERQLLYDFNRTEAGFPKSKLIHTIFEEFVEKNPDNIAVEFEDTQWTYRELNEKSNRMARILREKGVRPDSLVAVMLEKRPEMISAIFGILKAGGAYIPINPDYPVDRIEYMLQDSGTSILLTTNQWKEVVKFEGEIIDLLDEKIDEQDGSNLENFNSPHDLCYIIYTSGSTGKPKGVMISHHNVVRLLKNDKFQFDFNDKDVWTMFHSFCFDFSVWEMYGALLNGAKLIIVSRNTAVNPDDFIKLLSDKKVTVLNQTPGSFYNLVEEEAKKTKKTLGLRYIIFGGEALQPVMLKGFRERYPETKLINMYGITETTVHVTFKEITQLEIDENISNIGLPIPTLTTYVMDKNLKLVPFGVAGELCVGGDGVARGYLNRPDLTEKRFVTNPYRLKERIYRSGDLARRLSNGEMEYLGRIDFQVKIRGFRVELGEIENQLLRHDAINKVVVLAREDEQLNKYMCAYMVSDRELTVDELREFLGQNLPDYMIPSYFIRLDWMPLTPNGKVDRKALPEPGREVDTGEEYVSPSNQKEAKIVKVWQDVLGVDRIGMNDNFFALGGHSLKAVALVTELQKDFIVNVNDIFEHQNIAELAEHIKERKDNLKMRLERLKDVEAKADEIIAARYEDSLIKYNIDTYLKKNEKYNEMDLSQVKAYDHVLLTGVTGYLGVHLLREILRKKECDVYLPIRASSEEVAIRRLIRKLDYYFGYGVYEKYLDRIHVLNADLNREKFGMDDEAYKKLTETIDCIIHPAALVKHYGVYEDFHKINVEAVQRLLDFCRTGKKKDFNHVSTISVATGEPEDKQCEVFTEDECNCGQVIDNYYAKTKLESEEAVIAARENGVRANIFRIGNIVFDSRTGLSQENIEDNAFFNTVKSFVNLGVVPDRQDDVEFSFVDYVSNAILLLFDRENLKNETYHLYNSHQLKLSDILTSKGLNLNIEKLTFDKFVDYLYNHMEIPGMRAHVENVMLHRGWLSDDPEKTLETGFIVRADRTNQILGRLGFAWPQLDESRMKKMIVQTLHERILFMSEVPIFSNLSTNALETFAGLGRELCFREDSDIFWEGDIDRNFYIIQDGFVELRRHSKAGWLGTICVLKPGDFLGENNLWDENPSPITAEVFMKDASVLAFKADDLIKLIREYPDFGIAFLKEMNDRIRRLESVMVELG